MLVLVLNNALDHKHAVICNTALGLDERQDGCQFLLLNSTTGEKIKLNVHDHVRRSLFECDSHSLTFENMST